MANAVHMQRLAARTIRPLTLWMAALGAEAVAATTNYVLIDLSDVTNFPHLFVNRVILHNLRLHGEKAADGAYDIWVGVVTRVDATNGDVSWIHVFHLEASGNPTDSTDRFAQEQAFGPTDLGIVGGAAVSFVTNQSEVTNTAWQTDVGLASPVGAAGGATGKPGVGDVVVRVEEVSGAGTIDFVLSADYDTE